MSSSNANMDQLQRTGSAHVYSNLVSSIPIDPLSKLEYSIPKQTLPASLTAPPESHSTIIHSDSSISVGTETSQIKKHNISVDNYQNYCTTNTNNNSPIKKISSGIKSYTNEYINTSIYENSAHRQQPTLTEQTQEKIIHEVEHQDPPPIVIRKTLPNNTVTYKQNVSIRYLKPPAPPSPGPIIIREVRQSPPPPQSPIRVRQRLPPPPKPSPLILRERPPPLPLPIPSQVIEKLLPPPPPPSRQVIVERYPAYPPKPPDVVIERWLPYKQSNQRRILVEKSATPQIPPQEPNLLILHDAPHARIHKQFINQGVARTDPEAYRRQYGSNLNVWSTNSQHAHLVDEATRAVPPPLPPSPSATFNYQRYLQDDYVSCRDTYQRPLSPYLPRTWERARVKSFVPRFSSNHYDYSTHDSPYRYCTQSSHRYEHGSYHSSDDYYSRSRKYPIVADATYSWNRYCNSLPSSFHTIRVRSDDELERVLSNLTNGRVRSTHYPH